MLVEHKKSLASDQGFEVNRFSAKYKDGIPIKCLLILDFIKPNSNSI